MTFHLCDAAYMTISRACADRPHAVARRRTRTEIRSQRDDRWHWIAVRLESGAVRGSDQSVSAGRDRNTLWPAASALYRNAPRSTWSSTSRVPHSGFFSDARARREYRACGAELYSW